MDEDICPACGGDMKHWSQGIYECDDCGAMVPLDEIYEEDEDEFEYCEMCKDPLLDEDDVYEGLCNSYGDGNYLDT